jgi:hypothetical protein
MISGMNRNEKLFGGRSMNPPRLLNRRVLDNGLTLEFWDHSRPVSGDRWFVSLEVRLAIPVTVEVLPPELKGQAGQVVEALGEEIRFSHTEERNFIAAAQAPGLLKEMQERMLALAPGYFGHADFGARFIRQKLADLKARRQWQHEDSNGREGG